MNVFTFGNKKVPRTTAIFNMTSAKNCPSRKLNMCQLKNPNKCYAIKAERMYENSRVFRKRQESFWDSCTKKEFIDKLFLEIKKKKVNCLRISESGDFRNQGDVNKAIKIAEELKKKGITTYLYTARKDLDFTKRGSLIVNGSGFKVDNEFLIVEKGEKVDIKGKRICAMDCTICTLCQEKGNYNILVAEH